MKKKDLFKTIIREFHNTKLPQYIPRTINIPAASGKIITLVGQRRSGKTYMLYQIIDNLLTSKISKENIVFINFEDERLEINKTELDMILQAYRELYPEKNMSDVIFFFDEIQNVDGWEKFIRRIYDTLSKNIFITGSNSKLLGQEIATALRGRTLQYEVLPLSFIEFLTFKDLHIALPQDVYDSKIKAQLINAMYEYIQWGGLPEIVFHQQDMKVKILQEYFDVMIYRDLIERYNVRDIFVLKYFIKRMAQSVTKPLSINKIFNELKSQGIKVGKNTLYEFLEYCENAFLIRKINKHEKSVVKTQLAEKKVYFIDNGILQAIKFFEREDYGILLENIIFRELYRVTKNIHFFKDQKECDFIINSIIPIQVCFAWDDQKTKKRETDGLLTCAKRLHASKGYVVTFDDEDSIIMDGCTINVVPAYKLLLGMVL